MIDGEATQLKWATLDRREGRTEGQRGGRGGVRKTGRRPQLQRYVNEVLQDIICVKEYAGRVGRGLELEGLRRGYVNTCIYVCVIRICSVAICWTVSECRTYKVKERLRLSAPY